MPRPKTIDSKTRAEEQKKKTIEKIKQKAIERGLAQSRESQEKIINALGDSIMTFTELKNATIKKGLGDKAFKDNLNLLVTREEIRKVQIGEKDRYLYLKNNIKAYETLEFFAEKFLYRALRETGDSPAEFNQHLGSLITYVLTHYSGYEANHILETVLAYVQSQITKPLPENDIRMKVCGTPAIVCGLESPQWAVWKAIDSTNYITRQKTTKYVSKKANKKNSQEETYELPCSGRCVCNQVSDGCMDRLSKAKYGIHLKNEHTKTNDTSESEELIEIEQEVFDYSKFEKDWLSV